jgi:phosphate uptake regulator
MPISRQLKIPQTQTEVAVLQVKVDNIEGKLIDIKEDLRHMHQSLEKNSSETQSMIKEMRDDSNQGHKELGHKVSNLEKWIIKLFSKILNQVLT